MRGDTGAGRLHVMIRGTQDAGGQVLLLWHGRGGDAARSFPAGIADLGPRRAPRLCDMGPDA